MMAHFVVRGLNHDAAPQVDEDPDRLSFLHAVRVIRRKMSGYNLRKKGDPPLPPLDIAAAIVVVK